MEDEKDVYRIPLDETDSDVSDEDDPEFIEACRILSEGLTEEKLNQVLLRINSMQSAIKLLDQQYVRRKQNLTSSIAKYVRWYGPEIQKYLDANLAILNAGKKREVKSIDTEFFRLKKVARKESFGVVDEEQAVSYFLGDGKGKLAEFCNSANLESPFRTIVAKTAINRYAAAAPDKESIPGFGVIPGFESYYAEVGDKSIKIGESK